MFDMLQIIVLTWLMIQAKLKDEKFEWKVLADFVKVATMFIFVATLSKWPREIADMT
jgi:hypothetical protein